MLMNYFRQRTMEFFSLKNQNPLKKIEFSLPFERHKGRYLEPQLMFFPRLPYKQFLVSHGNAQGCGTPQLMDRWRFTILSAQFYAQIHEDRFLRISLKNF